jgi:nitrite reductase/ring-hydroxylating ferredoxin subunit
LLGERKKRIVTAKLDHQQHVGGGAPYMTEYHAGRFDELKERGRLLVKCGDAEVGIFLVDGELHAWHNECAHRGGPVCQGRPQARGRAGGDGSVRGLQYDADDTHIVYSESRADREPAREP